MQTQSYKVPHHGSYINDIHWKEGDVRLEHVLLLRDRDGEEQAHLDPLDLILPLVRRAYPDATKHSLAYYGNKNFTIIGIKDYARKVVVLYRHDYTWQVMLMGKQTFAQYQQDQPYYTEVEWEKLPSY